MMKKIHDLKELVETTMNRAIPMRTRLAILRHYNIALISAVHETYRFQCNNTDPRWHGKVVRARPKRARCIAPNIVHTWTMPDGFKVTQGGIR